MRARRTRKADFALAAHRVAQNVHGMPLDDLYFFRADNGLVKIGRSENVRNRLNHVRCSSPVGVMLFAVLEARGHEETLWHTMFAEHRQKGEWFKWCHSIHRALRLAQNGRDWWKANVNEPDTAFDQRVREMLVYLRDGPPVEEAA
jgi:hypothetical protein